MPADAKASSESELTDHAAPANNRAMTVGIGALETIAPVMLPSSACLALPDPDERVDFLAARWAIGAMTSASSASSRTEVARSDDRPDEHVRPRR